MDPLRTHVRKILRALAADRAAEEAEIGRLEAAGHRIVDGGQTDDGWTITDWRTGEVLASGEGEAGTYAAYSAATDRLDAERPCYHVDHIRADDDALPYDDVTPTDGIPPSLSDALIDWLEYATTPKAEIAAVAGWSVAEVERCI